MTHKKARVEILVSEAAPEPVEEEEGLVRRRRRRRPSKQEWKEIPFADLKRGMRFRYVNGQEGDWMVVSEGAYRNADGILTVDVHE